MPKVAKKPVMKKPAACAMATAVAKKPARRRTAPLRGVPAASVNREAELISVPDMNIEVPPPTHVEKALIFRDLKTKLGRNPFASELIEETQNFKHFNQYRAERDAVEAAMRRNIEQDKLTGMIWWPRVSDNRFRWRYQERMLETNRAISEDLSAARA